MISNDNGDVRPTSDPLGLRACGLAHLVTSAPMFIRPGPQDADPLAMLEVLSELGVSPGAVTFPIWGAILATL